MWERERDVSTGTCSSNILLQVTEQPAAVWAASVTLMIHSILFIISASSLRFLLLVFSTLTTETISLSFHQVSLAAVCLWKSLLNTHAAVVRQGSAAQSTEFTFSSKTCSVQPHSTAELGKKLPYEHLGGSIERLWWSWFPRPQEKGDWGPIPNIINENKISPWRKYFNEKISSMKVKE